MAVGYYRLEAPALDAQAVCTLFEAEANVTSCTVGGTVGESGGGLLFPDTVEKGTATIDATGGTYDIGAAGDLEEGVAEAATGATVQAALRALDSFGSTLTVTGAAGGPLVITLATDDPTIVVDGTDLTGGAGTAVYVITQTPRVEQVLASSGQVIFKVVGTTVAAITDAATALIAAEDDAGDANAGANVIVASGYPAVAI